MWYIISRHVYFPCNPLWIIYRNFLLLQIIMVSEPFLCWSSFYAINEPALGHTHVSVPRAGLSLLLSLLSTLMVSYSGVALSPCLHSCSWLSPFSMKASFSEISPAMTSPFSLSRRDNRRAMTSLFSPSMRDDRRAMISPFPPSMNDDRRAMTSPFPPSTEMIDEQWLHRSRRRRETIDEHISKLSMFDPPWVWGGHVIHYIWTCV